MTRTSSARLFLWGLIVTVVAVLLRLFAGQLVFAAVGSVDAATQILSWVSIFTQLAGVFGPLLLGGAFLARLVEFDPDAVPVVGESGFRPPLLSSLRLLWWGVASTLAAVLATVVAGRLPIVRSVDPAIALWVTGLSAFAQLALVLGPVLVVLSPIGRLIERQKRSRTDAYVHISSSRNTKRQ